MLRKFLLTSATITAISTTAFAQGFTGAELGIEFTDAPDDSDLGGVSYFASGEYALGYGVSLALDGSAFNYNIGVSDISNLTAHVIYDLNALTSLGLFFGRDFAG